MKHRFILCAASLILLAGSASWGQNSAVDGQARIRALIITGQATRSHDWRATTPALKQILEGTGRFDVRVTEEFRGAGPETLANYDVLIVNYNDARADELRWGTRAENAVGDFIRSGKGMVLYHSALSAFAGWSDYEKMSGGSFRPNNGHHSPAHDFTVDIRDSGHPVTRGLRSFMVERDDLYANLRWQPEDMYHVLATAYDDHSLYNRPTKTRTTTPTTTATARSLSSGLQRASHQRPSRRPSGDFPGCRIGCGDRQQHV